MCVIMAVNFDKFAHEGNEFINELAKKLHQTENKGQVSILVRAVLHVLRDRITIPQSFNLMAQLPMFLKGIYVDQWKYRERPASIRTMQEFCQAVEDEQAKYGEREFDWEASTEELVKAVLEVIGMRYISAGEISDIVSELPAELKQVFDGQEVA